ncbi:MAG: DUF2764 family protein [Candidatus Omnitrophota bacterium]|nr:DUF2764 family protein [Candidatus Omnitrophota bacterium]
MKNYYYIIASLPMLHFGMKPPFSYPDFLALWESHSHHALLKEWERFNKSLANELVRTRAVKKGKDPNKYLRDSDGLDPFIAPLAHWATNQDSPMEAELYLDKIKWEKIEELKAGHYFDIEYLIAYGLQLQILERWDKINSGDGVEILERLAGKI